MTAIWNIPATGLRGLFAQRRNLFRPALLVDVARPREILPPGDTGCGSPDGRNNQPRRISRSDRIWRSVPGRSFVADGECDLVGAASEILAFPVATFIRFHRNHGLLQLTQRPALGNRGSAAASFMSSASPGRLPTGSGSIPVSLPCGVSSDGVVVTDCARRIQRYDHVVMATHADQALSAIADPTAGRDRAAGRLSLQPQPRRPSFGPGFHAEAPRGLVELELYRLARGRR